MAEKIARNQQNSPGIPGGMGTGEKSKNLKKAYVDFICYLGRYKWNILTASIFSVIGSVLNLIGPNKLSEVTDLITEGLSGSIQLSAVVQIASLLTILCLDFY